MEIMIRSSQSDCNWAIAIYQIPVSLFRKTRTYRCPGTPVREHKREHWLQLQATMVLGKLPLDFAPGELVPQKGYLAFVESEALPVDTRPAPAVSRPQSAATAPELGRSAPLTRLARPNTGCARARNVTQQGRPLPLCSPLPKPAQPLSQRRPLSAHQPRHKPLAAPHNLLSSGSPGRRGRLHAPTLGGKSLPPVGPMGAQRCSNEGGRTGKRMNSRLRTKSGEARDSDGGGIDDDSGSTHATIGGEGSEGAEGAESAEGGEEEDGKAEAETLDYALLDREAAEDEHEREAAQRRRGSLAFVPTRTHFAPPGLLDGVNVTEQLPSRVVTAARAFDRRQRARTTRADNVLRRLQGELTWDKASKVYDRQLSEVRRNRYFVPENYDPFAKPIVRQPRASYVVRTIWTLPTSVWAERPETSNSQDFFETSEGLRRMFLLDWQIATESHRRRLER